MRNENSSSVLFSYKQVPKTVWHDRRRYRNAPCRASCRHVVQLKRWSWHTFLATCFTWQQQELNNSAATSKKLGSKPPCHRLCGNGKSTSVRFSLKQVPETVWHDRRFNWQTVDTMRGQSDVSIPTAIMTYRFRNLFRNEKKGMRTIFHYAEPALWRFNSVVKVVQTLQLWKRHVTSSA